MSEPHEYPRGSGNPTNRDVQTFAVLRTGVAVTSWAAIRPQTLGAAAGQQLFQWQGQSCNDIRLHRINTRQHGVIRVEPDPPPHSNLSRQTILNVLAQGTDLPNDYAPDYVGKLPLFVTVGQTGGVDYSFWMDPNQVVEVYASCITVQLWGPVAAIADATAGGGITIGGSGSAIIPPNVSTTATNPILGDHLTQVAVQRVDEPINTQTVKFTEMLGVLTTVQATISVPPRAIGYRIYTTDTVAQWTGHVGDPATGASEPVSLITFNASGVAEGEIGMETHLQTDSVVGARLFEIEWVIQP